jgi:hypothetical protein
MKDFAILEHNIVLSKKYGGKIPTYLLPIGHSKEQKQSSNKIKGYLETRYNTVETQPNNRGASSNKIKSSDTKNKIPRSTVTRFNTQKVNDPKLLKKNIMNNKSTPKYMLTTISNISETYGTNPTNSNIKAMLFHKKM